MDKYWRAANYLSVGRLSARQPLLRGTVCGSSTSSRACSATGGRRRVELHLRAPESRDQGAATAT